MSNRELPMLPWYPDQFAASTAAWTWIERAVYRALLDAQWAIGALPQSEIRLAHLADMPLHIFRKAWRTVQEKFPPDDQGGLCNLRLEEHRLNALARKQARVKAGRLGGVARAKQASSNARNLPEAKGWPLSPSPTVREEHPQPPQGGRNGLTASGRKPREERDRSLGAWRAIIAAIDQIAATSTLPAEQRLTWADLGIWIQDGAAIRAAETVGFRLIADRDKFTVGDLQTRFREVYEQQLSRVVNSPPQELHS